MEVMEESKDINTTSSQSSSSSSSLLSLSSLHQRKSLLRWTIRLLATLIATCLCLYALYIVSHLYYSYPTVVDARRDQSHYVPLPAVTVCSELASTVKVDELSKISPAVHRIFSGKSSGEKSVLLKQTRIRNMILDTLHTQSIDRQHHFTVSASQFFDKCHLPSLIANHQQKNQHQPNFNYQPSSINNINNHNQMNQQQQQIHNQNYYYPATTSTLINCSQFSPIVETISYEHKCFSLLMHRNVHPAMNGDVLRDVMINFKYLVWIQVNRDFIYNGFVYLHSPDLSHQYSSSKSVLSFNPNLYRSEVIAFDRETVKLLPPPYQTQCRNYRSYGFQCRDDCIAKCKVARYLRVDGWPGNVYAEANVTNYFSRLWLNAHSGGGHVEEGMSGNSLETCGIECGLRDDCERVEYDVRRVRVKERDNGDMDTHHWFRIGILPPKDGQMIIKHVPKYVFIQYLIYIGSIISMTLGCTVVTFLFIIFANLTFSTKFQTKHFCANWWKRRKAEQTSTAIENQSRSRTVSINSAVQLQEIQPFVITDISSNEAEKRRFKSTNV